MKYAKLLEIGRAMSQAELEDSLRGLTADRRFAAVAALIDRTKERIADSSCGVSHSGVHGALAHAAGGRCALLDLEGQLRHVADKPRKAKEEPPPEEE